MRETERGKDGNIGDSDVDSGAEITYSRRLMFYRLLSDISIGVSLIT